MRDADGSIMPAIITAHMIQMRSACVASHRAAIIHAPGPYMWATAKIQSHETAAMAPNSTIAGALGWRMTVSTRVGRTGARSVLVIRPARQSYAQHQCYETQAARASSSLVSGVG
jgi:hypothetical protein